MQNNDFEPRRIKNFTENNVEMHPHYFPTTCSIEEFITKCNAIDIEPNQITTFIESVAGRIVEKRNVGKKLVFYTVSSNGYYLQFLANIQSYKDKDNFVIINKMINRGDIIGAVGHPGRSKTNELSIYPTELKILSPCFKDSIPKQCFGIQDVDIRFKNRHFDLMVNPKSIKTLKIRSKVIKTIRQFLDDKDFIELQTPILSMQSGGASAKPFVTYHNDLKQQMFLRVAPELYLKQLVVGGFERVYEIGQQFRNESIDLTHVPEFTSLEFYMAYADYNVLMNMCEDMLSNICQEIHGDHQIEFLPAHSDSPITIDFSPPYTKIDIIPTLENMLDIEFPTDLSTDGSKLFLDELCKEKNIDCSEPRTASRLIDKLIGHYLEPTCVNPTFLINHPLIMSPLAKSHRDNKNLTERFELFVCGMELANAYTELNDHIKQLERFEYQQKDRDNGDEEAQSIDETFLDALKFGLPPTGGFGLGIDRMIMFMSNNHSIREVLAFPPVSEKKQDEDAKDGQIENNTKVI